MKILGGLTAALIGSLLMTPVVAQNMPYDQSQGADVDNMPYGAQMDPQTIEAMRQRHLQMQQYMQDQRQGQGQGYGMPPMMQGRMMNPQMGNSMMQQRPMGMGQGPGPGNGMGMNPQMRSQMMQQGIQHMQDMEQRLSRIEALLEQLVAAQSK
jgi:hypothetical protein